MKRQRKEVRLLAEYLGYGMEQLQHNAPTTLTDDAHTVGRVQRSYASGYDDAISRVCQAVTDLYGIDKSDWLRSEVWSKRKVYFFEALTMEEYETLCWLSGHGYDGYLLKSEDATGKQYGVTFTTYVGDNTWQIEPLTESQAWEWRNSVIDFDTAQVDESFLACNDSATLAAKLWKVLDSIV